MTVVRSVWDFPRPPAVEPESRLAVVIIDNVEVARSTGCLRVLETSHPPTIYFPADDVRLDLLHPASGHTVCEYKGLADYFDAVTDGAPRRRVAWTYRNPADGYESLRDRVAFYPGRADECRLGDEVVTAQEGDFYGGWITSDVVGPFKGGAGTLGW